MMKLSDAQRAVERAERRVAAEVPGDKKLAAKALKAMRTQLARLESSAGKQQ